VVIIFNAALNRNKRGYFIKQMRKISVIKTWILDKSSLNWFDSCLPVARKCKSLQVERFEGFLFWEDFDCNGSGV
jgi:hypothetical protein